MRGLVFHFFFKKKKKKKKSSKKQYRFCFYFYFFKIKIKIKRKQADKALQKIKTKADDYITLGEGCFGVVIRKSDSRNTG